MEEWGMFDSAEKQNGNDDREGQKRADRWVARMDGEDRQGNV